MRVSSRQRVVLRDLAKRVAEIASLPEQAEKVRLWTACNDLRPERAMVYADPQNGWEELDEAWMRLECTDRRLRAIEQDLQRSIVRHEHIPDDYPVTDAFDVRIEVTGSSYNDYGLDLQVERSVRDKLSRRIVPVIHGEADLARLHPRPIRVDHQTTDQQVAFADELFGDILRVRKRGTTTSGWRYGLSRVLIHMRGLENMMLDLFDNPGLIHRLMAFLRDDALREIDVLEAAKAVRVNNDPTDVIGTGGPCVTHDLPGAEVQGPARVDQCACWGESQETVGVGPGQFAEFFLQYQLPILRLFRLVAYGCCEPLDHKYDLLFDHVPNLRWVSVPPRADLRLAADKIANRYVYVYKPNPSRICVTSPDWAGAERDIREALEGARGCAVQIVMKDTCTFRKEPQRVTRWAQMAARIARETG